MNAEALLAHNVPHAHWNFCTISKWFHWTNRRIEINKYQSRKKTRIKPCATICNNHSRMHWSDIALLVPYLSLCFPRTEKQQRKIDRIVELHEHNEEREQISKILSNEWMGEGHKKGSDTEKERQNKFNQFVRSAQNIVHLHHYLCFICFCCCGVCKMIGIVLTFSI